MAQIAQVQITFVAGEDRLLMRLSTDQDEEFRFWLTRRFVVALRPHLQRSLTQTPRIAAQVNPQARKELFKFEQQQALESSDFKTPYKPRDKSLPLGEQPVLLTRFQIRPESNGNVTIAIGPEQGSGIDLALNPNLMHSISALMDAAIVKAEWAISEVGAQTEASETAPASGALN